jgi:hypothetical protein
MRERFIATLIIFALAGGAIAQNEPDEFEDLFNFGEPVEEPKKAEEPDAVFDDFFEDSIPEEPVPQPAQSATTPTQRPQSGASEQVVIQMLEKREIPRQLLIKLSVASPAYVSTDLMTWNSTVDFRGSAEFPAVIFGTVPGIDISTFKFENALPLGGVYSGISVFGTLSRPLFPGKLTGGLGLVGISPGGFLQQSYDFTFAERFAVSVDFRLTFTSNMMGDDEIERGFNSWFDLGISPGVILIK